MPSYSKRWSAPIRDIDNYVEPRRRTTGTCPSFALPELNMDIPDTIMEHPLMHELQGCSICIICLVNVCDIAPWTSLWYQIKIMLTGYCVVGSWALPWGQYHNILRVAMNQLKTKGAFGNQKRCSVALPNSREMLHAWAVGKLRGSSASPCFGGATLQRWWQPNAP